MLSAGYPNEAAVHVSLSTIRHCLEKLKQKKKVQHSVGKDRSIVYEYSVRKRIIANGILFLEHTVMAIVMAMGNCERAGCPSDFVSVLSCEFS